MGHLPISRAAFCAWAPSLIERSTVSEDELEGYHIWEESNGGVFT